MVNPVRPLRKYGIGTIGHCNPILFDTTVPKNPWTLNPEPYTLNTFILPLCTMIAMIAMIALYLHSIERITSCCSWFLSAGRTPQSLPQQLGVPEPQPTSPILNPKSYNLHHTPDTLHRQVSVSCYFTWRQRQSGEPLFAPLEFCQHPPCGAI